MSCLRAALHTGAMDHQYKLQPTIGQSASVVGVQERPRAASFAVLAWHCVAAALLGAVLIYFWGSVLLLSFVVRLLHCVRCEGSPGYLGQREVAQVCRDCELDPQERREAHGTGAGNPWQAGHRAGENATHRLRCKRMRCIFSRFFSSLSSSFHAPLAEFVDVSDQYRY